MYVSFWSNYVHDDFIEYFGEHNLFPNFECLFVTSLDDIEYGIVQENIWLPKQRVFTCVDGHL